MADGDEATDELTQEEASLWTELAEGRSQAARESLFFRHQRLARDLAQGHFRDRAREIEFGDLCQWAYAGLLEAIDSFNLALSRAFRPYAVRRIRGSILDGLNKLSEFRERLALRRRLVRERTASISEEHTGSTPAARLEALNEVAIGLAIGFITEQDGPQDPSDIAPPDPYQSLAWSELVSRLKSEVRAMPERQRRVIELHYFSGIPFAQIAAIMGVTAGRISQLHRSGLTLLQRTLKARSIEF